jgi:phospholipase C
VHGPNGFFREFRGKGNDPNVDIRLEPERKGDGLTGNLTLVLTGRGKEPAVATIEDMSYGAPPLTLTVRGAVRKTIPLEKSHGWYDLRVTVAGAPAFSQRFAGRMETGRESRTDPVMAGGID